MIGSLVKFLFYGFIWLFIFSIPVGNSKKLFDVGYEYIVDSDTANAIKMYILSIFNKTKKTIVEPESIKEEKPK